jgi:hypothetical protein
MRKIPRSIEEGTSEGGFWNSDFGLQSGFILTPAPSGILQWRTLENLAIIPCFRATRKDYNIPIG